MTRRCLRMAVATSAVISGLLPPRAHVEAEAMPNDGLDIAGRPPFRDEVGRAERLPDTGGWMRDELFDVDVSRVGHDLSPLAATPPIIAVRAYNGV